MGEPRKDKICNKGCMYYIAETETAEGECLEGEDINSAAYCEMYTRENG